MGCGASKDAAGAGGAAALAAAPAAAPEEKAAAPEAAPAEEEEELVPVEELETDADMVAAATKIQAIHRGRAARKEIDEKEAEGADEAPAAGEAPAAAEEAAPGQKLSQAAAKKLALQDDAFDAEAEVSLVAKAAEEREGAIKAAFEACNKLCAGRLGADVHRPDWVALKEVLQLLRAGGAIGKGLSHYVAKKLFKLSNADEDAEELERWADDADALSDADEEILGQDSSKELGYREFVEVLSRAAPYAGESGDERTLAEWFGAFVDGPVAAGTQALGA
jgi:hypothetical protein